MINNSGINKIILLGQVTKSPNLSDYDKQGVLSFQLLTKENIKKGFENIEHREYHNINVPQKLVTDSLLMLTRGETLYIEGKVQTIVDVDRQNIKRYRCEITVNKIDLIGVAEKAYNDFSI